MIKNLSIIFPLYNEENRLLKSFNKILKYCKKEKNRKLQIIFVNDGSSDKSFQLLSSFKKKNEKKFKITLVNIDQNRGKGFAINKGINYAIYDWILTTDIDHSVNLDQINNWEKKGFINKNTFVYIGSRTHRDSKVKKIFLRHLMGMVLSLFIKLFFNIHLSDTQCGFKLYKKKIAKIIFKKLIRPRYEHDVEIIIRLILKKIKFQELPVKWKHEKQSKVNIFFDPFKMFLGIIILKLYY